MVRVDDTGWILLVCGDTPAGLDEVSAGPGGSWVRTHLAAHLAGPPERVVAEIVAGRLV